MTTKHPILRIKICLTIGLLVIASLEFAQSAGINSERVFSPVTKSNEKDFVESTILLSTDSTPTVCDPGKKLENEFSWEDYSVVGSMLVISCGIGLYFAIFGEKQTTSDDFLLGGSSMGTLPMAMSLAAR